MTATVAVPFNVVMGLRRRLFALVYDRQMAGSERAGLAEMRARLLSAARGDVLEVGAGTGLNLQHYGPAVTTLALTEPDPSMLRRLRRTVENVTSRQATVISASAEDLPFDDASFDTVVCTLVLCGVDDQPRAVREMRRVLEPGGQLLLLEHVRSKNDHVARRQARLNWLTRLTAGCECDRPTRRTIEREGFVADELADVDFPKAPWFVRPMIVGRLVSPVARTM